MTGYAAVQSNAASSAADTDSGADTSFRLGVEIRSVNSRFLDL
ncbi:MAG: YicC family protein, partial [Polaromonas sp.]|nr:YicC family protein [Polaromonas sp.]